MVRAMKAVRLSEDPFGESRNLTLSPQSVDWMNVKAKATEGFCRHFVRLAKFWLQTVFLEKKVPARFVRDCHFVLVVKQ